RSEKQPPTKRRARPRSLILQSILLARARLRGVPAVPRASTLSRPSPRGQGQSLALLGEPRRVVEVDRSSPAGPSRTRRRCARIREGRVVGPSADGKVHVFREPAEGAFARASDSVKSRPIHSTTHSTGFTT